ncbi:protein of unknown function [Paraburkholderia dioscoreae]|uniref:Uncharacterized protein n=1 Tax=Paraburkholderia dioscoreae TaxID=2604047 RepID=A0A5Q4YW03_9BURK|nr:protein of unknown function [Paraburkholderia dioscoreae]
MRHGRFEVFPEPFYKGNTQGNSQLFSGEPASGVLTGSLYPFATFAHRKFPPA